MMDGANDGNGLEVGVRMIGKWPLVRIDLWTAAKCRIPDRDDLAIERQQWPTYSRAGENSGRLSAKVVGQHVALERQVYTKIWTCPVP